MTNKRWNREQIFGKANQTAIPFNKETEAWIDGRLTGVGKARELNAGGSILTICVQPTVKTEGGYKNTFSVNRNRTREQQDEFRAKMVEKGYLEHSPLFVEVKYSPEATQMYELLRELSRYDKDSGKLPINSISVKYSEIVDKDKDGKPMTTVSGETKTKNFADIMLMSFPPDREADFKAIFGKYSTVNFEKKAPEATVAETPAPKTAEPEKSFNPVEEGESEFDGPDMDIPF